MDVLTNWAGSPSENKAGMLLASGADINARNKDGDTPLLLAAEYCVGDTNMAGFLIAYGADVNARDKRGYTALTIPKYYLCPKLTALLREHGARDPAVKDADIWPQR